MPPSEKRKRPEKSLDRSRIDIIGLVIAMAARRPLSRPALLFAAVGLGKIGIGHAVWNFVIGWRVVRVA